MTTYRLVDGVASDETYRPGRQPTERRAMPQTEGERITLMIADDAEDLRALVRFHVQMDGRFSVVGEAGDGQHAVDLAQALQPDIIVLDLAMPVMDGLAALGHIHSVSPATRVLVLSGFEDEKTKQRTLSLCADGYLVKGASLKELVSALVDVVHSPPKCRAPL
ncbi:MAG: response regulator transcription factor [Actinomycetota bacterium]